MNSVDASIGFRAKTGRAIAIALNTGESEPTFLARWEVCLYDPNLPATGQPHHEVMELPWTEAQSDVKPLESRIQQIAIVALSALLNELNSKGHRVTTIGVMGSLDRNLDRIGNPHIRAHAAEGILFRRALEVAATAHALKWRSFSDRDFEGMITEQTKVALTKIGRAAGKPWRADERAAAAAAWLVDRLHRHRC